MNPAAINREERSRYKHMFNNLSLQNKEETELRENDADFKSLEHLLSQRMLKIDRIQTFTYVSLSKRMADHSYFRCCVCDETFEVGQGLNKHREKSSCWGRHEQLIEFKQKLYACRICDRVYKDYKFMIIHIVTELLANGYTVPNENLDLSQCITILYIEQLCSEDVDTTMRTIKDLLSGTSQTNDQFLEDIENLEHKLDAEMYGRDDSNDYPPELVIDLDGPGEADEEVRVENHFMVNASMNEFRANQKFMAVPKNNVMVKNKIRKKSKSPPQSLLLAKGPSAKKVQKNDQDIIIENIIFEKDDEDQEAPLSSVENTKSRLNSARGTLSNVLKLNHARGSLSNALTGVETNQNEPKSRGSKTVALLSKLSSQETLEKALVAKEVITDLDTSKDPLPPMRAIKKEPIETDDEFVIDEENAHKAVEAVSLEIELNVVDHDDSPSPPLTKNKFNLTGILPKKQSGTHSTPPNSITKKPKLEKLKKSSEKKEGSYIRGPYKTYKGVPRNKPTEEPNILKNELNNSKNLPPPIARSLSGRKRTPKRKFAIDESMDPDNIPSDDDGTNVSVNWNSGENSENSLMRSYSSDEPLIQEPSTRPRIKSEPRVRVKSETRVMPDFDNSMDLNETPDTASYNDTNDTIVDQINEDNLEETPKERRARKREESALFSGLSKIVKLPRKSKADIMIRAKEQIEKLNEVSSELQKQLHMEMSRNQQLKNELERCQQPPIKLKIQHGKSVLPDD